MLGKELRKVWGKDHIFKKWTTQETSLLKRELGMNRNAKNVINNLITKGPEPFKSYTRTCKYCGELYKVERFLGEPRPIKSKVCPPCRQVSTYDKVKSIFEEKRKIWKERILLRLEDGEANIKDLVKFFEVSKATLYKYLGILSKENKIKIFHGQYNLKIYSLK